MKREEVKAIFPDATDEQLDKIMGINGADINKAKGDLDKIKTELEKAKTDLAAAIRTSLDALDPAADDHNAIILISDGGDLRGGAMDAAALAKRRNVPIFTVGIGDPKRGATIPAENGRGELVFEGKPVKVKLEERALKAVSEAASTAPVWSVAWSV